MRDKVTSMIFYIFYGNHFQYNCFSYSSILQSSFLFLTSRKCLASTSFFDSFLGTSNKVVIFSVSWTITGVQVPGLFMPLQNRIPPSNYCKSSSSCISSLTFSPVRIKFDPIQLVQLQKHNLEMSSQQAKRKCYHIQLMWSCLALAIFFTKESSRKQHFSLTFAIF